MLRLADSDSPRQGAERADRPRVAVGTDEGEAWKGHAETRHSDVDNAKPRIVEVEQADTRPSGFVPEGANELGAAGNKGGRFRPFGPGVNRVVERTEHQARVENGSPTVAELLEGHGPGSLVQRDPVDVEKL